MALVRVYCGLSADDARPGNGSAWLSMAVVDDSGRLLAVCDIPDDPNGYAQLSHVLAERSIGSTGVAVAADSDDHLVTMLLTAAGRPLAFADDDSVDDFAERFADDQSTEELESPLAERRAVGLARALQAGALSAVSLPAPREMAALKPVLAAHAAIAAGRHAAAVALREVLRELYPAALRAYPDPADTLPLAILEALPEPGLVGGPMANRSRDAGAATEAVVAQLAATGLADSATVAGAITALRVAVAETPRRTSLSKSMTTAVASTVRGAVAAVRACDSASATLIGTLLERTARPVAAAQPLRSRNGRGSAAAAATAGLRAAREATAEHATIRVPLPRRSGPAPVSVPPAASTSPQGPPAVPAAATPQPVSTAPAAAAPHPVSAMPAAPVTPAAPTAPTVPAHPAMPHVAAMPMPPAQAMPMPPAQAMPMPPAQAMPMPPAQAPFPSAATASAPPYDNGRGGTLPPPPPGITPMPSHSEPSLPQPVSPPAPFRTTVTTVSDNGAVGYGSGMPDQPAANAEAPPGSRANWPLINAEERAPEPAAPPLDPALGSPFPPPAAATNGGPGGPRSDGRVTPPWQADDLPPEPPLLRLVEPPPLADPALHRHGDGPGPQGRLDPPPLRLVDGEGTRTARGSGRAGNTRPAVAPASVPPMADEGDSDLLIFAATRSAWFTDQVEEAESEWGLADAGWRAAEQAARPSVDVHTESGLPKRVPQANLVPGSPNSEPGRALRIVRDPAAIAAHTSGYFSGYRRGQEISGYAVGGRPGRDSAQGWDFNRDHGEDEHNGYEYPATAYRSR